MGAEKTVECISSCRRLFHKEEGGKAAKPRKVLLAGSGAEHIVDKATGTGAGKDQTPIKAKAKGSQSTPKGEPPNKRARGSQEPVPRLGESSEDEAPLFKKAEAAPADPPSKVQKTRVTKKTNAASAADASTPKAKAKGPGRP